MKDFCISKNLKRKRLFVFSFIIGEVFLFVSCSSHKVVPPPMEYPKVNITVNRYEYGIENIDETAKCDRNTLSAYYDGLAVKYMFDQNCRMYFEIENKTNKSLIIDKAKSFVIYNGYSVELFKNVRTGKVTTYNDVQDAINSVQTNESSVTMSIPPYSKWKLPIEETNIKMTNFPKKVKYEIGSYPETVYSSENSIEFVIPYTFDYTLVKWKTSRNKLYNDNIEVFKTPLYIDEGMYLKRYSEERGLVFMFLQDKDTKEWYDVRDYNMRRRFLEK